MNQQFLKAHLFTFSLSHTPRFIRKAVLRVVIFNPGRKQQKFCTHQQPPQRGGAVPNPVWVGSKWLLTSPRVSVTLESPHIQSFLRRAALWTTTEGQHSFSPKSVDCPLSYPHFYHSSSSNQRRTSPSLGPHLSPNSVRWKCDQEGQVGAKLHLLQMGASKMLNTLPLRFHCSRQISLLKLSFSPPVLHRKAPSLPTL